MQKMVVSVQQGTTPTGPQKSPTNYQQIYLLQMNTAGTPVYHIDALEIQSILTQTAIKEVGDTQGRAQESNTDEVIIEFKV